jgi:hypothetical protein
MVGLIFIEAIFVKNWLSLGFLQDYSPLVVLTLAFGRGSIGTMPRVGSQTPSPIHRQHLNATG